MSLPIPELARIAAQEITRDLQITGPLQSAIFLGSGWQQSLETLGTDFTEHELVDFPGFHAAGVAGHAGRLRYYPQKAGGLLCFLGRIHKYEGYPLSEVVHPISVAAALGVTRVVLTNAAGGINRGYRVGELVLISDHINLMGVSPLVGPQFVNMVDAYDPELITKLQQRNPRYSTGVYVGFSGPQFETPAEIRMAERLGGDLAGMSTVPETIMARAYGLKVTGISLVANLAAGITGQALTHEEVLETSTENAIQISQLLAELVELI